VFSLHPGASCEQIDRQSVGERRIAHWVLDVAVVAEVPVAERGGALSLVGNVLEAWLSLAAWMMTVRVEVEVSPF
jgi:hypothetical protein